MSEIALIGKLLVRTGKKTMNLQLEGTHSRQRYEVPCSRTRPSINRTLSSASLWSGVTRNSPRSLLLFSTLTEMADNRKQTAKESKGIRNRLKKAMGLGSRSTPQSRSNSPSVVGLRSTPQSRPNSPSAVVAPPVVAPAVTVDLEEAAKLRAKYTHFRILVIGRANAGKTTLLKRVCNTTEEPSIYDKGKNLVSYPTYRDILSSSFLH